MMGIYCWLGRGMDIDLEEAKRWLKSAAARGYEEAKAALDCMAEQEER
jgi:TPR repeat protein